MNSDPQRNQCNFISNSQQVVENSSHSTAEANAVHDQNLDEEEIDEKEEIDLESGIMDRADVLFKYILRSFRKYYCK